MNFVESSAKYGCRNSGMPLGGIGAGSATTVMEREGLRFGLLVRSTSGKKHHLALGVNYGLDPIPDGWFYQQTCGKSCIPADRRQSANRPCYHQRTSVKGE